MGYQVSTPVFEGPFDLLLHLVTRQQVDIWELSLSSIVDEFVATIERMQALDLSVATEFLLTAAVLLELKARRLLPESSDGEDEEELALWEERDLLLARLLECKTFKDASQAMSAPHGRFRPQRRAPQPAWRSASSALPQTSSKALAPRTCAGRSSNCWPPSRSCG